MVITTYLQDPLVHMASACALALLLATSGLQKLRHPQGFVLVLEGYAKGLGRWLRPGLRRVVQRLLPPMELLAAAGLLCSPWLPAGALPALALLVLYALVLAASLKRGGAIQDCGCHFGATAQPPSRALVWRNLLLILLALNLLLPMDARPLSWFDALVLVLVLMVGSALYLLAHLLLSNHALLKEL